MAGRNFYESKWESCGRAFLAYRFRMRIKLIRELNKELRKTGCITIAGRIDHKSSSMKFCGTREPKKKRESNGSV